jgi:membrane protein implicated in regulation of membrane protease activity
MDFISVTNIKRILLKLKGYWDRADVPGKMLILVFFTPSILVLLWLLFEIAYFIVFELPLLIIKIFAKIVLFCVFWYAAVYFYEKLNRVMSEKTVDVEHEDSTENMEDRETEKKRKVGWRKKD